MNEKVLEGIIKLLAIIANIEGSAGNKRAIIEKFLRSHINQFEANKALFLFDEYVGINDKSGLKEAKAVALKLKNELSKKQRIIILVHLVELVLADQEVSDIEDGFMITVCEALNIKEKFYNIIKEYIAQNDATELTSDNILLINERKDSSVYKVKHRYHAELDTTLAVLRFPETEMYFVRLMLPTKDLTMSGDQLNWEHIYAFAPGNTIQGSEMDPLYYSEVVSHFLNKDDEAKVSFEANNISYYFPNGGKGLHNVNIAEESGKLVALMGASGSGKSTLLNVLNGNLAPQIGSVKINGIDIYRFKEDVQGVIGYVPQDDLLIEDLSVYQNLFYAARLCFGKASDEEIDKKVEWTLRNLGLFEIRELRVGNALDKTISGGQRKRLNIGLELLRQPSILFVDEPTSGLSSRDSENIIDLLRQLSLMGKLIFVVIHQPSSDIFKIFDKLVVLDVGGYQIYYGNPVAALMYFRTMVNDIDREEDSVCTNCGNVKVEEIFNIIENRVVDEFGNDTPVRKVPPNVWYNMFTESTKLPSVQKVLTKPPSSLDIPKRWKQVRTFATRDLLAKLNNHQYLAINLLQAPLLAFILAFIVRYYQVDELTGTGGYDFSENKNLPAFIFMSIIVAIFMGLTVSAEEIIKDAKILKRESYLELSRFSYLFSKILILFGLSAIQTLLYVLVGHYILEIKDMTLTYWVVLFSSSCFANMLGLNISATFNSVITIYILIPLLLIPQLLLGGVVVKFDDINPFLASKHGFVPFIADIITSRWAFEAISVSQFKDNEYEKDFYEYDRMKAEADYKRVYYIPALRSKLEKAMLLKSNEEEQEEYKEELQLLQSEINKEHVETPKITCNVVEQINVEDFEMELVDSVGNYLSELHSYYNRLYKASTRAKDKEVAKQIDRIGREAFTKRLRMYHNESVMKMVTNTTSEERIIEYDGQLIQKIYPIYQTPPKGYYEFAFMAHFFAPRKYIFGRYVSTLAFNIGFIWTLTLLLYGTLYFNFFRGVGNFYSNIFQRRKVKH
ncbi:ATP-binding cassette domain-containing protein [Flammeovirgaceae bacterium SG7u.111]|nr:ATP-binding cassette domain-containing protein [Flammeovirgaceae bacterium SG7u.132]WPO36513.1 ATP-binding cassette domain-containing protein [Flammeovirgaceae bacterium SG7u.111]